MDKMGNIGFIGYGNMAQSMVKGLIESGGYDKNKIYACAKNFEKLLNNVKSFGIHAAISAEEVVRNSDLIILAVKPHLIESVVADIVDLLKDKTVISIAAGYDFDRYEKILRPQTQHISTIPNTPISVGEGILVCESKHSLKDEEFANFIRIFSEIALIEMVDTAQLSAAGTLSGCTPAFTAMYLEALADAGVKYGISREGAYRMAAKMICGTGKLYLESGKHPGEMKDAVCSPGGTTIKGVSALEKGGFRGSVIGAIDEIEGK